MKNILFISGSMLFLHEFIAACALSITNCLFMKKNYFIQHLNAKSI